MGLPLSTYLPDRSALSGEARGVLRRIRVFVVLFVVGLVVSGATAIPLAWEMELLTGWMPLPPEGEAGLMAGLREPQGMLAPDRPFPGHVGASGWLEWLHLGLGESSAEVLRTNTRTGHPCGSNNFVKEFEERLGRILEKQPVGRPRKLNSAACSTEDLFGEE